MRIKIGFSASHGLVSKLIMWFTRSKVSHAWLLLESSFMGEDMVMQAVGSGFQLITYKRFLQGSTVIDLLDPKQPIDTGVQQAVQWLGERYDTLGILGEAFVMVGRRLKQKWRNLLHSNSSMWCSEAIVYVLKAASYPRAEQLDPTTCSPEDLLEFLRSA